MEIDTKIQKYIGLLDNDKAGIKDALDKWLEFVRIPKDDSDVKLAVDTLFNKFNFVIDKLTQIKNAYTKDLPLNYTNFIEFYEVVISNGHACYKEINDLISGLQTLEEVVDEEEDTDEDDSTDNTVIKKLVQGVEQRKYLQFHLAILDFYKTMDEILIAIIEYGDSLYIRHTGDVTVGGTRKKEEAPHAKD